MPLRFNRTRHFALLAAFAVALAIAGPRPGSGMVLDFALFGALHALALALTIGGDIPPFRRFGFVTIAALLAGFTAQMGMFGGRVFGSGSLAVVLAASAGFGALIYGVLVRLTLIHVPRTGGVNSVLGLGAAVAGCAMATVAGFILARQLHQTGLVWLAVPWWLAFSGSLAMPIRSQTR